MGTITKTVFKVGDFVSWAQNGQLDLSPRFQRRPVWKPGAKSYLIDTITRGLPIPIVFLRDKLSMKSLTTSREVVDGQQRLRTLLAFINADLLEDFADSDEFTVLRSHNPSLAGKTFSELPDATRRAIMGYEIPVHVFSAETEDRDILQIFARLNATGVKLSPQELRNAEYFGEFKTLAYQIAYENLTRWEEWGVYSSYEISRMTEVEDVSDLIISMIDGVHGKTLKSIDNYYAKFDKHFPAARAVAKRFEAVMGALETGVGKGLAAMEFSRRALFNDLFVAVYHVMYGIGSSLTLREKPGKVPLQLRKLLQSISDDIANAEVDNDVAASLRAATSDVGTRLLRVNFILSGLGYAAIKGKQAR